MAEDPEGNAAVAQTERIGLGDLAVAAALAAVVFLALTAWGFPGLHPGVWNDAAVACGVRPASRVMPGLWIAVASALHSWLGFGAWESALRIAGRVSLAGIAVCVYAVLREMLAFVMRARPQFSRRRTMVMRFASAIGAMAFVAADPVWNAGQCFCETTVLLAISLGALEFFFVFLRKGSIKYAYICSALLGLLAAESPLGFLLPVLFISLNMFVIRVIPSLESPLFKPAVIEVGKWHMTFLYLAALIAGIALNCRVYVDHNGLGAAGETLGSLPLAYLLGYWSLVTGAGDALSWLLWLAICITPFLVTVIRFPVGADEERFLPYTTGMVLFFCGTLAFSQSAFLPALWFWTYFPMQSQYLLSMGLLCCAMTVACGITVLGVDAFCRDHARLARQVFGDDEEDASAPVPAANGSAGTGSRSTLLVRRAGLVAIPVFLVVMVVPGRVKKTTRLMMEVVGDAVREIVREAGDAKWIFTDGNLDRAIEMGSAAAGGSLKCISLMGGADALNVHLRTRGMDDDREDLFSFGIDAGMGLRSWIRDRPEKLSAAAVQMGFDLWKRDGKPLPPMGGMLSRPAGFASEEERLGGIKAAHELAKRFLAIHSMRGGAKSCTDIAARNAFFAAQWRIARMCEYRGEADDLRGLAESAIAEVGLAKRLNDTNEAYRRLLKAMERRNEILLQKLTAREGLQLALVRADFAMGRIYAETILGADPTNPDANFAMGMYYLKERQLSRAEEYLKRCLVRRPEEPAVYNNLAMIQIEVGKLDAAEANLNKAIALVPDSAAVADTRKKLEKARAASRGAGGGR